MPDDINSNYSLPDGSKATTGQTVLASQHNIPLNDIASCMTDRLNRRGTGPMLANLPMGGFKVTGLAPGTADTDAATVAQVSGTAPIGVVQDYSLSILPTGWLWCDGSVLLSTTQYPALRTALIADGFKYGQDGSGNPKLPRCNGRTRVTRDDLGGTDAGVLSTFYGAVARLLGGVLGTASHTLTAAQIAAHTHPVSGSAASAGAHRHDLIVSLSNSTGSNGTPASSNGIAPFFAQPTEAAGEHSHSVSGTATANTGGQAHPNAQPSIVFNTIIRAV